MVFCNSRRTTDYVVRHLRSEKIKAVGIHGGLSQSVRSKNLNKFNNYRVNVLVCTVVAARGLHIDNVSRVFNYDIPKDPNDYIHRIGRTARAGDSGKVINLISMSDNGYFLRIVHRYSSFEIENLEMPGVAKFGSKKNVRNGLSMNRGNSMSSRGYNRFSPNNRMRKR